MRSCSLRDIKRVPKFSHLSELELVKPKYDEQLIPVLYALGMDTNQPMQYLANNMRDYAGETGVGIRIVGELRTDREFINSGMCNTIERIILSGQTDVSLMMELVSLMAHTLDFKAFFDENEVDESEHEDLPLCLTEPNWKDTAETIDALNNAILQIRGCPFREDGSLKTWQEYK